MEDPKQAFVEYATLRTDKAGGLVSNFKASQDARLSKFEADSKQQQSEMTNKIDIVLKGIIDRIAGALPSNAVKTPKLRNFTYIIDFMIVEDISSIIDPRLSQVVLGRPFVEISNMTHDPPEGMVRFTNETNEIAYKMPHKIEQYNSLSDLKKEHTKSVYLRNKEDKKRGVEYVMNKILGFYKECLELGPEYATGMDDEGEVTKFLIKNKEEIFTDAGDGARIYPDGVSSPAI
nr:protein kinase-like domain, concanavalin A-like lectin/glucanase domain protein [Tanacetum cinerariifolium]